MAVGTSGSSMDSTQVQLLGPVRAWRGDAELNLGSARRRAVFAILALQANEAVSRAELVDGLWGEQPPAKAVGILHTYISDLRRALDPARDKRTDATVLTRIQSSYSLRLPIDQLDERRFASHHDQARRHWARGDLAAALDALDTALALWHGEALHGVFGPFAELQRARLAESRITAVERRGALLLIRGDHERVRAELAALVTAAPLRETARGLLMVAMHQAGRRDDALALFADTERMLDSELGLEPGPALRRIRQEVAAGRVVPADAIGAGIWTPRAAPEHPRPLPVASRPAPPPLLVGRDDQLTWLRSFLPGLLAGHGDCVGLEGAPGIGKTAVVAAAFAEPAKAYDVVWCPSDELREQDVSRSLPRTGTLVEQLCARRPLVFVVDDLQAADDTGLLVWHGLCRLTQQLPLLLIGVFRTLPSRPELVRLRRAVGAAGGRISTVEPLTAGDIAALAAHRLGETAGPRLRTLLAAAAGNPSTATELLAAVTDAGAVRVAAGVADVGQEHHEALDEVATSLVRQRFALLAPDTRKMLRLAALLGRRFDLGDLAAVLHTSPADLIAAVDEAIGAGMLDDREERLAFRSALLHRAQLADRPPATLAAQHRHAAKALAQAGMPVERVAAQLLAAAPVDAWTAQWLVHNIDAVAAREPATARALLDRATAGSSPDDTHHDTLALHRVRLAFRLGDHPADEASALLATTSDPEHAAELRWILAQLDYRAGDAGKAVADLRAAAADDALPASWRARYETLRARFERAGFDDLDAAEQLAGTALRHAVRATDPVATAEAHTELWHIATVRRDHATALTHADTALAVIGTGSDLAGWQLDLLDHRAFSLQNLDRLDEASGALDRMRTVGARRHPPSSRPHVATAIHDYWLGRWDEALAQLALVPPGDQRAHAAGVAALIAGHRGETDQLRAHLRACPAGTTGDDFLLMARAIEAGVEAGTAAALAAMDPLLDPSHGRTTLRHPWLPQLLRLALEAGDRDRVASAMRVGETEAAREVAPARARAALRWCRALADRDPEGLLGLARHFGAVGRPVELAAVLVDAAVAFAARREPGQARHAFREALPVLTELRAAGDITRAEARLRALGVDEVDVPAEQPTVAGWRSLSALESRIARLVAAATPNPEIAEELALSRRDVQLHLSRIMRKLGLASRADLADRIGQAGRRGAE
ncbi:BTAD domain-containing putative transcriptional regulator [Actinophytocola sediminis]